LFEAPLLNVNTTATLKVFPQIDIVFLDAQTTQQYNTAGEKDLYLKIKFVDAELETINPDMAGITATTVATNVVISYLSTTIPAEVVPSPTSGVAEIYANVYKVFEDTTTRNLNITITASKSGYYSTSSSVNVQMVAPSINIVIQINLIVPVGDEGFNVLFENPDRTPYNFPQEVLNDIDNYITVSIIKKPEEIEYSNKNGDFKLLYLESPSEHKVFVDYKFDTIGEYEIVVKYETSTVLATQREMITVQSSMLPDWFNPMTIGLIFVILIILYLLFHKGKKEVKTTW